MDNKLKITDNGFQPQMGLLLLLFQIIEKIPRNRVPIHLIKIGIQTAVYFPDTRPAIYNIIKLAGLTVIDTFV